MKKRHAWNYDHVKEKGEVNDLPSLTVPDQTMTIQEILQRYTRGLPIGGQKVPFYELSSDDVDIDDVDFIPDPKTMDFAEREEFERHARDELRRTKEEIKKIRNKNKSDEKENKTANDSNAVGDKSS